MGESCEEGGPCPSHKIPQVTDTKLKCSEQCFIHLPKCQITIRIQTCSVIQFSHYNPLLQCRCLLFIEDTSITIDCRYSFSLTLLYKIRNQLLLQHAVTTVCDCVFLLRSLAVVKLVNEPQPSP